MEDLDTADSALLPAGGAKQWAERFLRAALPIGLVVALGLAANYLQAGPASSRDDHAVLTALDEEYQKAVERNDGTTMARILTDDYVLVDGNGKIYSKADLINDTKSGKTHYEHQKDSERTIRIWGDTAVVTAKLWVKGLEDGEQVNYEEWFSDTYVRTPQGWRYAFGQASLPLAGAPAHQ